MVKDFQNTVFLGLEYFCSEGDVLWNMNNSELRDLAEKELVEIGILNAGKVRDYHIERVCKAYPAYFDSYGELPVVINYLNTFDNLFCVGRNGQHRYNNMDHSMATAFCAVDSILSGNTDKTALWSVNTEKEYHEEKRNG